MSFRSSGVFFYLDLSRTGIAPPQKVNAVAVTTSLFETLGVNPAIGRYFTPSEQEPGGPHAVVLSEAYWRAEFGQDRRIFDKTIQLNGEPYSVVGVMPDSFRFPNSVTQMWVPIAFKPSQLAGAARQNVFLRMYARLAPDVSFTQAAKRLDRISHDAAIRNRGDYSVDISGWKYFLVSLADEENHARRSWTWVLFASVMLLFVIVCLNAGSLLLLRSNERAFDTSVRLALGASWRRLARRTVAETGAICLLGGTAGLLFALAAIRLLNRGGQLGELHFAAPVFLFGAVMTAITTAVCALYPVLAVARANPADALNAGAYQSTGSRGKQHWRRALVITQVAASTVLLAVGGLLLESYIRLLQAPLGFEAQRVATMQISLPPLRYQSESSRRIFYDRVLEKIRHTPGVTSASACMILPFGYGETAQPFRIAGQPATSAPQFADVNRVLPEFFHTLRIPLVAGRFLDARDRPGSEPAVLIDQRLARQYFADRNPVGQQIELEPGGRFSIVGVVGTIRVASLDAASRPALYFSAVQMPVTDMSLVVKTSAAMDRLPAIAQDIVAKIDANQPVYDIASLESRIEHSLSTRHFVVWIVISFAAVGIAITAIGLYGLLSYAVSLRRREFGIRAALGANPHNLAALVFRHGVLLAMAGALTGGIAAIFAARYLSSELYGVRATDSLTWLSIGVVLSATSALACIGPSWRASRTSPLALLKQN